MELDHMLERLQKFAGGEDEPSETFFETVGYCIRNPRIEAIGPLFACLEKIDEPLAWEALLTALARQPEQVLAPWIGRGLAHASSLVRRASAELARTAPDDAWREPLLAMLEAEDALERLTAVSALEKHGCPSVQAALGEALSKERDRDVSLMIVDVLALAGRASVTMD